MAGINRAKPVPTFESYAYNKATSRIENKPCIFLSHNSSDKEDAIKIGDYIMEYADLDIYLDIYDDELQSAATANDANAITSLIERGISSSTHTMCLVSENTVKSWWVPFELGYAKKSGIELCSLKLKGDIKLPEYLSISPILMGTKSLNSYIDKIVSDWNSDGSIFKSKINSSPIPYYRFSHPLDSVLDCAN